MTEIEGRLANASRRRGDLSHFSVIYKWARNASIARHFPYSNKITENKTGNPD